VSDAGNEPALDLVSQLVPATLKGLHALEFAGRHVSPTTLPQLIDAMKGRDAADRRRLSRPAQLRARRAGDLSPVGILPADQPVLPRADGT
jgi:hypothetical protein